MEKEEEKHRGIVTAWLLVILWMGVIFLFSAQQATASGQLSGRISTGVLTGIHWLFPRAVLDPGKIHLFVRKGAHFSVYAVLGVLSIRAWTQGGCLPRKAWLPALLVCLFYAVSDEIHQIYIPGRAGQFADVAVDGLGSILGIVLFLLWRHKRSKNR